MADFTYGGDAGAGSVPRIDMANAMNWAGAAMSLALVAGLGWWGYTLAVRDVTGVPVVRALEGPMRIAPENPGGDFADHQGLAVSAIAAEGEAEPPADRLILAPPPLELEADDRPQPELLAEAAKLETPAAEAVADPEAAVEGPAASEPAFSGIELALAEALGLATPEPAVARGPAAETVPVAAGGVIRSPRPMPRPEGDGLDGAVLTSAVAYSTQPGAGVPSLATETLSVPSGGRLVQLGAFDNLEQLDAEWRRLVGLFGEYLDGKPKVVEEAVSNGRQFYRLRAGGFEELADARRFCAALVAGNAACIPVTPR